MSVDLIQESILSTYAYTIHLDRVPGSEWTSESLGDRFKRIASLKECLFGILQQTTPLCVSVESPFFNRFRPQAYGVLMEVMSSIRETVFCYDAWMVPYLIDPSSVKNAVGAHGAAKKEVIQAMILSLPDLNPVVDLRSIDEHSIDAIAVNYARFKRLFSEK
jgi:Holliday junction resolvasome RuvABC endonuclease subunit